LAINKHKQASVGTPRYAMESADRQAVLAFLSTDGSALRRVVPTEQAEYAVLQLRCAACHDRDGVTSHRRGLLSELSDGQPPEVLPSLTWTGDKLRSRWLEQFLAGGTVVRPRPWLTARMPRFAHSAHEIAVGLAEAHGRDPQGEDVMADRD